MKKLTSKKISLNQKRYESNFTYVDINKEIDLKVLSDTPIYRRNPDMLVPWYLMTSYLYYKMDESVISDEEYDWICKELDKKWNEVEHQHKHFVDRDALSAGTGFQLRKYPARVEFAAKQLLDDCKDI